MSDRDYRKFSVRSPDWGEQLNWIDFSCKQCGRLLFGYDDDPVETTLAELVFLAQAHVCE